MTTKFFTPLAATCVLAAAVASPVTAWSHDDLETAGQRISFLHYLRSNVGDLYPDFILRENALELLDEANEILNKIDYSRSNIEGLNITISTNDGGSRVESVDVELFAELLARFVQRDQVYTDSSRSLMEAIRAETSKALMLNGLNTAIIVSGAVQDAQNVLRKPLPERMRLLETQLASLPAIPRFDPRRLGMTGVPPTGREFLTLYNEATMAQFRVDHLLWLGLVSLEAERMDASLATAARIVAESTGEQLSRLFDPEYFRTQAARLAEDINFQNGERVDPRNAQKVFRKAYDNMAPRVNMSRQATRRAVLSLQRAHPYEAWVRGSVGDCSTCNSYAISLADQEQIYWLRGVNIDGSNGSIRGYLQLTRVLVDGEYALFVNTISGAQVSRTDAVRALAALASALPELNAKSILLPMPEKLFEIINYPEVEIVFSELAKAGSKVEVEYLDSTQRATMAPYIHDDLDQPGKNKFAMRIRISDLPVDAVSVSTERRTLLARDLFPKTEPKDALIIALDLKNRDANSSELTTVLNEARIDANIFADLWSLIVNTPRYGVDEYHQKMWQKVQRMNLDVSWDELVNSSLLYRGHFAAPDALAERHRPLAIKYLSTYLLSYSDVDSVYEIMKPHLAELTRYEEFNGIVRTLFSKAKKEMQRVLDSWELDHKSAYRTILNLFEKGMPMEPFTAQVNQLRTPIEEQIEPNQPDAAKIKEIGYVMRLTLLATLNRFNRAYHREIMNFLKRRAADNAPLMIDSMRAAARYLYEFTEAGATAEEIDEINRFVLSSPVGLRFVAAFGKYPAFKLNIPAFFDAAIRAEQPMWAAYLVQAEPWPRHPQAARWLNALYEHREAITAANFLAAFQKTPSWLDVPGIERFFNWFVTQEWKSVGDEAGLARVILQHPGRLSETKVRWLENVTHESVAGLILKNADRTWRVDYYMRVRTSLLNRFPQLSFSGMLDFCEQVVMKAEMAE